MRVLSMALLLLGGFITPAVGTSIAADTAATCPAHKEAGSQVVLEIRPSTIEGAGLGVFLHAKSAVAKRGTVLTTFGDRDLFMKDGEEVEGLNEDYYLESPVDPKHYRTGNPWAGSVPSKVEAGVPVGHLLNDGATIVLGEEWPGQEGLDAALENYVKVTESRCNIMVGNFTGGRPQADDEKVGSTSEVKEWDVIALRDLQPGEELFMSYGPAYWLTRLLRQNVYPMQRLLVYMFLSDYMPEVFAGSDDGYLFFDQDARPMWGSGSPAGEEASELQCERFVTETMRFGEADLKGMGLDVHKLGGYKQLLINMAKVVVLMPPGANPQPHQQQQQQQRV